MRKVITPKLRFQVLNRDNFTCQYCGLKAGEGVQLQVDHKISIKNGGTNTINNLITSCFQCNIGKGKNNIEEIKNKLYETKISDNIGKHLLMFYKWWNFKKLGNICNNTKALLNICYGAELGGEQYIGHLDYPFFIEKYLNKKRKDLKKGDMEKLDNLFKEGGEFCDSVLSMMEGPFGISLLYEKECFEELGCCLEELLNNEIWNGCCYDDYNYRLNYILTEKLINIYNAGCYNLKNNFSIKKFSYFYNQINNG